MNVSILISVWFASLTLVKGGGEETHCSEFTPPNPTVCAGFWAKVKASRDDDKNNIAISDRLGCLRAVADKCGFKYDMHPADLGLANRMVRIVITHPDTTLFNLYTYADTATSLLGYIPDE